MLVLWKSLIPQLAYITALEIVKQLKLLESDD